MVKIAPPTLELLFVTNMLIHDSTLVEETVVSKVGALTGLAETDLLSGGHQRPREISRARQAAAYTLVVRFGRSKKSTARLLNLSDHTSVLYTCRKLGSSIPRYLYER